MNVFVLSMLVYVCTFFPFPYEDKVGSANKRYEGMFRRYVVSMQTGYKWFHLIRAPGHFGPSPPLIDPWARALATLASQTDLAKWNGITAEDRGPEARSAISGSGVSLVRGQFASEKYAAYSGGGLCGG